MTVVGIPTATSPIAPSPGLTAGPGRLAARLPGADWVKHPSGTQRRLRPKSVTRTTTPTGGQAVPRLSRAARGCQRSGALWRVLPAPFILSGLIPPIPNSVAVVPLRSRLTTTGDNAAEDHEEVGEEGVGFCLARWARGAACESSTRCVIPAPWRTRSSSRRRSCRSVQTSVTESPGTLAA